LNQQNEPPFFLSYEYGNRQRLGLGDIDKQMSQFQNVSPIYFSITIVRVNMSGRSHENGDVLSGSVSGSVSLSFFFDTDPDTNSDPGIERFEIGSIVCQSELEAKTISLREIFT